MTIKDAIKTLDGVIPEPDNKMVDLAHLHIATAWKTIRKELIKQLSSGDLGSEENEVSK